MPWSISFDKIPIADLRLLPFELTYLSGGVSSLAVWLQEPVDVCTDNMACLRALTGVKEQLVGNQFTSANLNQH